MRDPLLKNLNFRCAMDHKAYLLIWLLAFPPSGNRHELYSIKIK